MVQFPRFRLATPTGRDVERLTALRVTPFGHPRISGCLLLLVAFRSLPRPSSPSSSKASAVDPCPLAISPISPSLYPTTAVKTPSISGDIGGAPALERQRTTVKDPSSQGRASVARSGVRSSFSVQVPAGELHGRRVEVWGLEPQTYGLQSHRSSHLSYTPGNGSPSASVTTKKGNGENGAELQDPKGPCWSPRSPLTGEDAALERR